MGVKSWCGGEKNRFLKKRYFHFFVFIVWKMAEIIILLSHSDSLKKSKYCEASITHWKKK